MKYKLLHIYIFFTWLIMSCSNNEHYFTIEESPVVMDLTSVPYPKLSDYYFFEGALKNQTPSIGVLPYKPTNELFTDYAKKSRFIWLPKGAKANYLVDNEILSFPIGSCLIKTFYYDSVQPNNTKRIIETRVLIKKNTEWIIADYIWNNQQTEAYLDLSGSTFSIDILQNNVLLNLNYKIPSANECATCHLHQGIIEPIGVKPQNLNSNFNYQNGSLNQLTKWISNGILENNLPQNIVSVVDCNDQAKSLNERVRSYFDIQCAHCHREGGTSDLTSLRFSFMETTNPSKMGVCVNQGIPVPGINRGHIVSPNDIENSTLFYMINTTNPSFKMPRIGRTVKHKEGVLLIEQWINSLGESCP